MIQSSHLHEPSVVKEPDSLVGEVRLPSSLTIPRCLWVVGYTRPLETGIGKTDRTPACTEQGCASRVRLVIVVEDGEVSSVFDERSDKYLNDAQLKEVYTLDSLFLGRAPR